MTNYLDNLDVIDSNGQSYNVLIQDRNTLALANNAITLINNLKTYLSSIYPTIKDYGAAGDGITDDSSAFSDCINANDVVVIPDGTYLINYEGSVSNKLIIGMGGKIITTTNIKFSNFHDITIYNLEIDGQSIAPIPLYFDIGHRAHLYNCHIHHGTIICLQFSAADGAIVDNCVLHDTTDSSLSNTVIAFNVPVGYPTGYEELVNVVNNTECYNGGLDGIIANMHYCTITNCSLHDNGVRQPAAGIYANSKYNHIYANNQSYHNSGNGIDNVYCGNLIMTNNYCSNNDGAGIFTGDTHGAIISSNVCNSNGSHPLADVQSAGIGIGVNADSVIVSNNISNLNVYGIKSKTPNTQVKLSGNLCNSNTTSDISMESNYELADFTTVTV